MRIIKLFLLLAATALFAACSSDDSTNNQSNVIKPGTKLFISFQASKGVNTRALSETDNKINATWATNEHVHAIYEGNKIGDLTPDANASAAWLRGYVTFNDVVEYPGTRKLRFIFPLEKIDYTGQDGTLQSIAKKYDFATVDDQLVSVESDQTVKINDQVTFTNRQAIVRFELLDENDQPLTNLSSLRISASDLLTSEIETGDITISPTSSASGIVYAALSGINQAQVLLTAKTTDGKYYAYKKNDVSFLDGKYYPVKVNMTELRSGVYLSEINPGYIGWVVGDDGKVYPDASAVPSGVTAVAMVAYVERNASNKVQGLAIALHDESEAMTQWDALQVQPTTVDGTTWTLPSREQWANMLKGCGGKETATNQYNITGLNSKLARVGTKLNGDYWTDDYDNHRIIKCDATSADLNNTDYNEGLSPFKVRMCLKFDPSMWVH